MGERGSKFLIQAISVLAITASALALADKHSDESTVEDLAVPGTNTRIGPSLPRTGAVSVVSETHSHRPLGSGLRLCADEPALKECRRRQPNSEFWITAAHVLNRRKSGLLAGGSRFDVIFSDEGVDLGLLASKRSGAGTGLNFCYRLSKEREKLQTSDVDIISNPALFRNVFLETADPLGADVVRGELWTPVARSFEKGVPGRDETGELLLIGGQGFRGESGGAIADAKRDSKNTSNHEAILLGMILNFDGQGRQVGALQSTIIATQLKLQCSGKASTRASLARISVPNGTLYPELGIIALRGTDGGTGNQGDGSSGKAPQKAASGLLYRGKRYLSLGQHGRDWSEFEAAPEKVLRGLVSSEPVQAVWEQNGKVFVKGGINALPDLIDPNLPGYIAVDPASYVPVGFSQARCWKSFMTDKSLVLSSRSDGHTFKFGHNGSSSVVLCEASSANQKIIVFSRFGMPVRSLRWELVARDGQSDCDRSICELRSAAFSKEQPDSLRTIRFPEDKAELTLSRLGGFRFISGESDNKDIVVGPLHRTEFEPRLYFLFGKGRPPR